MVNMNQEATLPLVIGFVADLFFTVKIQNVIRGLGYDILWLEKPTDIPSINNNDVSCPLQRICASFFARNAKQKRKITRRCAW